MAMYDDILKQMQGAFIQNNPKRFGQPGGFMQQNFNFNAGKGDDIIKPGGGGVGTGGGDDGDVGGGSGSGGSGSGGGSGNPSYGPTTYGGQFGSTFSGIDSVLASSGQSGFNLYNPAEQFGYGSEYSEYFGTFDIGGYNDAMSALQSQESRLLSDIGQQFQARTGSMQASLQDTLLSMIGDESTSGLVGGRQAERRRLTRQGGEQQLENLGQETQARYAGVQERIGRQIGQLEGTLLDFIANQANVALNLMQSGATKDQGTDYNTTAAAQPRGNSMTAAQLSEYKGRFGDLSNSQQAFAAFVQAAHTNLNATQLAELANNIYSQYQQTEEEESVG